MIDKSAAYRTYFGLDLDRHQEAVEPLVPERFGHAPGPARPLEAVPTSTRRTSGPWTASPSATGARARKARRTSRCTPAGWPRSAASTSCPWASTSRPRSSRREGWKIPTYVTLAYSGNEPWPGLYKSNTVYIQLPTKGSLPTFYDLNFRIEKKIAVGAGKMYFMADVFNVLNSAIVNRAYDAYYGVYYVNTGESAGQSLQRPLQRDPQSPGLAARPAFRVLSSSDPKKARPGRSRNGLFIRGTIR